MFIVSLYIILKYISMFCVHQPFPRQEYGDGDMDKTLSSLGLVPTGSLVLKRLETPAPSQPMDVDSSTPVQDTQPPALPVHPPAVQLPIEPPVIPPQGPPIANLPMPPVGAPGMPPFGPPAPPGPGEEPSHQWGSGNQLGGDGEAHGQPPPQNNQDESRYFI